MFYLQSSNLLEWKEYVIQLRDVCSVAKVTCRKDGLYLQVKEPGLTSALIVVRPSQFTHYSVIYNDAKERKEEQEEQEEEEDIGYWNLDEVDKFLKEHIKLYKCYKTMPNLIIQKVPIVESNEFAYRFTCIHELGPNTSGLSPSSSSSFSSTPTSSTAKKLSQQQLTSRTKLPPTVRRSITLRSECTTCYYNEAELLKSPSTIPFYDFYLGSSTLFETHIRHLCFINTSLEIMFNAQKRALIFIGTSHLGTITYEFQVTNTTESYECPSLFTTHTIASSASITKVRRMSKKAMAAAAAAVTDASGDNEVKNNNINSPAVVHLIHSPSVNVKNSIRFGHVLLRPLLMLSKLMCASTNLRLICCPNKPLVIALYKKQQFFGVLNTVLSPSTPEFLTSSR